MLEQRLVTAGVHEKVSMRKIFFSFLVAALHFALLSGECQNVTPIMIEYVHRGHPLSALVVNALPRLVGQECRSPIENGV